MKNTSGNRTMMRHVVAALAAFWIGAAAMPAFGQDGPTPTPPPAPEGAATPAAEATVAPTATPAPSKVAYSKQWDYEYRNSYLLSLPIGALKDVVASGQREDRISTGMYGAVFPPLLANTPHKKLQKVRQEARNIWAELTALAAAWQDGSVDPDTAVKKAAELGARQTALVKAIERLYYQRRNTLTELWFLDLHSFALERYRLWMEYYFRFDEMPAGFADVAD